MWRRVGFALGAAGFALGVLAMPASAGGWAVSSLDPIPAEGFRAGESHRVGYTILQHGQTPVRDAWTAVEIQSVATGETARFAATPEGPAGHYVATVQFPAAGEYAWKIDQSPFAPQSLGKIAVAGPAAAQTQTAASTGTSAAVLPIVAAVALAAFGLWLLAAAGRPRGVQASAKQAVSSPE